MTREKKLTAAVCMTLAGMSFTGIVHAAEQTGAAESTAIAEEDTHALNETVVTAQRRVKRDLDTPATTTIITAKEIEKAGYRNVYEAIDQQIGATSTSFGDAPDRTMGFRPLVSPYADMIAAHLSWSTACR